MNILTYIIFTLISFNLTSLSYASHKATPEELQDDLDRTLIQSNPEYDFFTLTPREKATVIIKGIKFTNPYPEHQNCVIHVQYYDPKIYANFSSYNFWVGRKNKNLYVKQYIIPLPFDETEEQEYKEGKIKVQIDHYDMNQDHFNKIDLTIPPHFVTKGSDKEVILNPMPNYLFYMSYKKMKSIQDKPVDDALDDLLGELFTNLHKGLLPVLRQALLEGLLHEGLLNKSSLEDESTEDDTPATSDINSLSFKKGVSEKKKVSQEIKENKETSNTPPFPFLGSQTYKKPPSTLKFVITPPQGIRSAPGTLTNLQTYFPTLKSRSVLENKENQEDSSSENSSCPTSENNSLESSISSVISENIKKPYKE